MRTRSIVFASLAAWCSLAGCKQNAPYVPGAAKAVLGVSMTTVRAAITARLDSGKAPSWVTADRWKRVNGLYRRFGNAPLWLEADGVRERGDALLKAIEEAPTHALVTDAYPLDSIRSVVNSEQLTKTKTPQALADADVLLTTAYVAYASDMLVGQVDPKSVSQSWHIPVQMHEVDSSLVRSLQSPSMQVSLAAMAPQDSGYSVLRNAFARYKQIVAAGGWPQVTGSTGAAGAILRKRLAAEDYLSDTTAASADSFSEALKQYQERHGLAVTGRLSSGTVKSLNVPADERLQQIASNLERMRWLPRVLGSRYIFVNVPAFRVEAYDSGQKKLEMKVVVGSEYEGRSTPVFSDSMEFVVFRPYWNVTPTIAAKEFFPKYGTNLPQGYETYREKGALRIRQRPGEKNSLGLVKFLFPNDFNIYLHDTPAKALFQQADRAASHGCIRLEHPDEMAEFVLGWDNGRVQQAMHGPDNRTVTLERKIPVYIVYFTAYGLDGQLYFGDDIYGRDDALEEEMADTLSKKSA